MCRTVRGDWRSCEFTPRRCALTQSISKRSATNPPISPGPLWYNPKQIATVLISFVSCTMGSPQPPKKSPRDSEWRFSNYHGSKVKVSQSETRIQKWANKRRTYRVWCRFIGNRPLGIRKQQYFLPMTSS